MDKWEYLEQHHYLFFILITLWWNHMFSKPVKVFIDYTKLSIWIISDSSLTERTKRPHRPNWEKRFSPLKEKLWKHTYKTAINRIRFYRENYGAPTYYCSFFIRFCQNLNREFSFKMQIESIEGFTEVCGRKKKNVKKLTANLNIKRRKKITTWKMKALQLRLPPSQKNLLVSHN